MVDDGGQDLFETLVANSVELKAKGEEVLLVLNESAELLDWLVVNFVVV